ncbi:zinc finger protein RFP-like isoform X2 [Alligator mississippiensis]|uniref:zinc finger protein RFP-like isoform X2 n=1 Tax=Alligator mississippiensis TaxID=8496 RepID=UPI0028776DE2|nr:zinc finger protein RFP-like isoform X2 [Alligator mississippiensis]
MAAASAVQSLRDEVTCSVCLELFTDPVMILGCGHNFCRACIAQCWEGAETDVTCPQCRQTFAQRLLGPNRQLGNLVEVVKGLSVGSAEGAWGRMVCEQHGEALKLFCETDQVLMCVICRESRAHRAHPAAPIQEAAQQCKEQIQTQLQLLNGERERLEALRGSESQKHEEYQQKAAAERQKIVAAFERLRRFLKEQERLVLAELGEVESGIEKSQGETVTQLSEEISHVTNLIRELEGKCQQAASDLLQDMRSTLSRYVAPPDSPEREGSWRQCNGHISAGHHSTASAGTVPEVQEGAVPAARGDLPRAGNETQHLVWTNASSTGDSEEVSRDPAVHLGEGQKVTRGIIHKGDGDSGCRHGKSLPRPVCGSEKCEMDEQTAATA